MNHKLVFTALLGALLLAPGTTAALGITPDEERATLTPDASTTVGFNATVACQDLVDAGTVLGGGTYTHTATLSYAEGLSGPDSVDLEFDATPCVTAPTGVATTTGSVDVVAGPAAPGLVSMDVTLTDDDGSHELPVMVGYRMGHSLVVDAQFPLEIGEEPVSWNGTLLVTANADTMVMTLKTMTPEFGTIDGFFEFLNFNDIPANGTSEAMTFTYTPTGHDWTNDTFAFQMWSHSLEVPSEMTEVENVTWSFTNVVVHDHKESKGSPSAGSLVTGLALVGAALVASRRK